MKILAGASVRFIKHISQDKCYRVAEWFENKIANEVGKNILDCSVFAILKETDKAVYAMMSIGPMERRCMWIPKSVLIAYPVGEDEDTHEYFYKTIFTDDYEEAVERFKDHWLDYM